MMPTWAAKRRSSILNASTAPSAILPLQDCDSCLNSDTESADREPRHTVERAFALHRRVRLGGMVSVTVCSVALFLAAAPAGAQSLPPLPPLPLPTIPLTTTTTLPTVPTTLPTVPTTLPVPTVSTLPGVPTTVPNLNPGPTVPTTVPPTGPTTTVPGTVTSLLDTATSMLGGLPVPLPAIPGVPDVSGVTGPVSSLAGGSGRRTSSAAAGTGAGSSLVGPLGSGAVPAGVGPARTTAGKSGGSSVHGLNRAAKVIAPPLLLAVLLALFVAVQSELDRRHPKLANAPVRIDDDAVHFT
jgi:hypothetical protein